MRATGGVDGPVRRDGWRDVDAGPLRAAGGRRRNGVGTRRPGKLAITKPDVAQVSSRWGAGRERRERSLHRRVVRCDLDEPGVDDVNTPRVIVGELNRIVVDITRVIGA